MNFEKRNDCEDFEVKEFSHQCGECQTDGHYLCAGCKHIAPFEKMELSDIKMAFYPVQAKAEREAEELSMEQSAIEELKAMTPEELDKVPFELKKWCCQAKGCTNGTKIRDYGISPHFYSHRKGWGWMLLTKNYFLCGKHDKFYRRLLKSFSPHHVHEKLIDYNTIPYEKVIDIKQTNNEKFKRNQQIEESSKR